jgi:ribosomal protein S18 acetylase RimI-like enzyme
MNNIRLIAVDGKLDQIDKDVMVSGMLFYHASKGHPRKSETFSVSLKDDNNKCLGCIVVSFLWNGMEIQSLWIDDPLRHQGWGRKLVETAETEAIKRGCTIAYTNTFTWQAPEFYKKLGYTIYGELDDFPKGSTLYYFQKALD